jgi:hypothetical protein
LNKAINASPTGKALKIVGAHDVVIERFQFQSVNAVQNSESSIAAVVQDSTNVILRAVEFDAGNGAPGKDGTAAADPPAAPGKSSDGASVPLSAPCKDANAAPCNSNPRGGSEQRVLSCATGPYAVTAGTGGYGDNPFEVGALEQTTPHARNGSAGSPNGGAGGEYVTSLGGIAEDKPGTAHPGQPGKTGKTGQAGSPASADFGAIFNGDYVPANAGADGTPGSPGTPGGGGSGGAGFFYLGQVSRSNALYLGGGGGAGGFPGCGGAPGHGGAAGGASIALLSIKSTITLNDASLQSGNGGAGGSASLGGLGQPGGEPGKGGFGIPFPADRTDQSGALATSTGADGGRGGDGGSGGPGSPGAGGPSIALVVIGAEPQATSVTYLTGAGGPSGKIGGAPHGAAGRRQDIYVYDSGT